MLPRTDFLQLDVEATLACECLGARTAADKALDYALELAFGAGSSSAVKSSSR